MKATAEQTMIERELAIAASPETVWELLVDPEKAVVWMGMTLESDPRPGGAYRMEVIPGHVASGEYVEVDRPRKLVFTWGWEPGADGPNAVPPGSSTIEYELVPDGDGTLLRFTHRDLPTQESADSHAHGWDHYLERLAIAGAGGAPGADPWLTGQM